MVEHDLAKVGVASSNLVSRSIFFILLVFTSLFSSPVETLYIQKSYCIQDETLKASFFGYIGTSNTEVINIPKERQQYALPSYQIINALSDKNVSVVDVSGGVVTFQRHCRLMGKAEDIEAALRTKIKELSPSIVIERGPIVSAKSSLPSDFERYVFDSITLYDSMLKKGSGSFIVNFFVDGKAKKIYLYYDMHAKLPVFKAKRNLQSAKILEIDDYEPLLLDIDMVPSRSIIGEMPSSLITRNYIKEGQVLSEYLFDIKKDIMKKESIKALYKEGSLVIEIHVILQEDANIGDRVKVKTEHGKVLNAKILSHKEAIIIE